MENLASQVLGDLVASRAYHWMASTLSQHEATASFYSSAEGILDELVEKYQGRYGKKLETYSVTMAVNTQNNILEYFNTAKTKIEDMRFTEVPQDDSVLQNVLDELIAEYDRLIYKLTFL
jgi:DNA-binding ferritin-like protein